MSELINHLSVHERLSPGIFWILKYSNRFVYFNNFSLQQKGYPTGQAFRLKEIMSNKYDRYSKFLIQSLYDLLDQHYIIGIEISGWFVE